MNNMILSASGWRGIFAADGDEESRTEQIREEHKIFCACAAKVFAEFLTQRHKDTENTEKIKILIGTDTRPTGKSIIEAMIPVLLSMGCDVKYAGIVAAPEIMAWARTYNINKSCGFIYVSASHNPIGHNGLKFGLTDGGVLGAEEANKLIKNFNSFTENKDNITKINSIIFTTNQHEPTRTEERDVNTSSCGLWLNKKESFKAYYDFCGKVVSMKNSVIKNPPGIVCDFNGSARTVSIDKDFFTALGFKFKSINDKPGQIVHRIVPEGDSLEPCARLLEEAHAQDPSFVLGYVPDCDGDRGNLVIWDDTINKARHLEAQEVFALACLAEFAHLDKKALKKAAVAINDPTSMRIDRIAECFGISVFRAEVGEANVVTLARNLREEGYHVRILGEGSAGGNITHPSAVRDPINTVLAIAKLLTIRSVCCKAGLYKIWCKKSGQMKKYKSNFTLADIIKSLPQFATTAAYNENAIMRIKTADHAILKDRYQEVFLRDWEEKKTELKEKFGFCGWEAIAYNGTVEKRNLTRFGEAGRGGLKVLFKDSAGKETAYIWMRGSATEPVFRIMADVEGTDVATADSCVERYLLDWQRQMIMTADTGE